MLTIQEVRIETTTVLALNGRLDVQTGPSLDAVIPESGPVLLDLSELSYVSSAGFREFFLLGRQLQRLGGGMAVCALQPDVKRIFDIAQFQTAYPVCATRDEALVAIGSSVA